VGTDDIGTILARMVRVLEYTRLTVWQVFPQGQIRVLRPYGANE
jgi:hypothetical protein